jgi:hypothetical protein
MIFASHSDELDWISDAWPPPGMGQSLGDAAQACA